MHSAENMRRPSSRQCRCRKDDELAQSLAALHGEGHAAIAIHVAVVDGAVCDHVVAEAMRAEWRQLVEQRRGGAIVNIGSIAGLTGLKRQAAIDDALDGIRVNSLTMVATHTPMTDRAQVFVRALNEKGTTSPKAMHKRMSLAMASDSEYRMAKVWERAAIIFFLLFSIASNLTGGVDPTDSEWTACRSPIS